MAFSNCNCAFNCSLSSIFSGHIKSWPDQEEFFYAGLRFRLRPGPRLPDRRGIYGDINNKAFATSISYFKISSSQNFLKSSSALAVSFKEGSNSSVFFKDCLADRILFKPKY